MSCKACSLPVGGVYIIGCRQCTLRRIARGPEFFESERSNKLTPAYTALLKALGPVSKVHREVKAVAASMKQGSLL